MDLAIFGEAHIYADVATSGSGEEVYVSAATCAEFYECDTYDPEGVLGWISAAWMTFLGLQMGRGLRVATGSSEERRSTHFWYLARWLGWGAGCAFVGAALAGFSKEGGPIPINKNLWSPSFVLVTAAVAMWWLALSYLVVDAARIWSGNPFRYMGLNSIVIYFGHDWLGTQWPFMWYYKDAFASHAEEIASNIVGVLAWCGIARILYIKNIFVTV